MWVRVNRHEAILTALHELLNVLVKCLEFKWRRRTSLVDVCRLHPPPFYPETECVESKVSTTRKILRITIPEVGALAGFRYFSLSLCGRPVGLGLIGTVVVTLGLIGRSRDAPKKIAHWLSGFAVALLACGNCDRFGLVVRHFESRHLIGHDRPDNRPCCVRSAHSEGFAPHLLDSDWIIEQPIDFLGNGRHFIAFDRHALFEQMIAVALFLTRDRAHDHHWQAARQGLGRG